MAPDTLDIEENERRNPPLEILEVFPNPFGAKTDIRWTMGDGRWNIEDISLNIYDISGQLVRVFPINLCNPNKSVVSVCWHGKDDTGQKLPSGVYFLKFVVVPVGASDSRGEEGDYKATKKLILLK